MGTHEYKKIKSSKELKDTIKIFIITFCLENISNGCAGGTVAVRWDWVYSGSAHYNDL